MSLDTGDTHRTRTAIETAIDACPGPCNRAWEAAELHQHRTGEPHNLQPVPGQPIWCPNCRDNIATQLLELPDLAVKLSPGKLKTPPADVGRLSRADIHASPSPAYDLIDELIRWAADAEDILRERLGHPKPPTRYLHRTVAYLHGHLTAMLNIDPHGIDFGLSVARWKRRLTTATGHGTDTVRVPGRCPRCDQKGRLTRSNGEDLVRCNNCRACWDYDHWQLLVKAVVEAG